MDPKEFIKAVFEEFKWDLVFIALFLFLTGFDRISNNLNNGWTYIFFSWFIIKRLRFHPVQGYKNLIQKLRKIFRIPAKQK